MIKEIVSDVNIDDIESSSFDLILYKPDLSDLPVKGDKVCDYLYGESLEMIRTLKSSGSLVVVVKEGVTKGKRDTSVLEYLLRMSQKGYWVETFIWEKSNPSPTGNQKRLKDGFEYCYQFTRTSDYKCYPDHCLTIAQNEWSMGDTGSIYTRPSNVLKFPKRKKELPVGLIGFFIGLFTLDEDMVFIPNVVSGKEILCCLNNNREYYGSCPNEESKEFVEGMVATWKSENIQDNQSIFG